ncbi:MAG: dihydroorotase [Acidimicrobiia bacterium]
MHDLVIRNGNALTPDGVVAADVAIDGDVIAAIGEVSADGHTEIDATGSWVGPGFVDIHTHLREPGQEWKEDVASGSAAAAAGGYTAIIAMPNTDPAIDSGHLADYVKARGASVGLVDVVPAGCLTMGRAGTHMAHIDELWDAGVRIFTDDGDALADASLLRLVMDYIAQLGGVVSQHAVDPDLAAAGYMHEGHVSSRLGMYGIPGAADDVVLARDIDLARLTGARYHVQHLSTARGVDLVAAAKAEGLAVTAEVTPHHLMYTDADVASTNPDFKMMPPLRSEDDRQALIAGLRSGVIDAVATDHAPHAAIEKEVPFEVAPNGVLGLEWAAAVANMTADLDQAVFFDRMSVTPAAIAMLDGQGQALAVGNDATLVVFDPAAEWTAQSSVSRSRNAPYLGATLKGQVRATVLRGATTGGSER